MPVAPWGKSQVLRSHPTHQRDHQDSPGPLGVVFAARRSWLSTTARNPSSNRGWSVTAARQLTAGERVALIVTLWIHRRTIRRVARVARQRAGG